MSYYLVKIVPYWGLALLGTCLAFLVPLLYTSNQELIDNQIAHASEIINAQTAQIKQVAGKHTAAAADLTKQYMGDYTSKAQQILRSRTGATPAPASKTYKASDFPDAPKEPLAGKTTGAQPEPVAS